MEQSLKKQEWSFEFPDRRQAIVWLEAFKMHLKRLDEEHKVPCGTQVSHVFSAINRVFVAVWSMIDVDVLKNFVAQSARNVKEPDKHFFQPFRISNMSRKLRGALDEHDIHCLGDLLALQRGDILSWKSIGPKTVNEFVNVVHRLGHEVGCLSKDWRYCVRNIPSIKGIVWTPLKSLIDSQSRRMLHGPRGLVHVSSRLINQLCQHDCEYLGDAFTFSEKEVLSWRNAGAVLWREIANLAYDCGYEPSSLSKDWKRMPVNVCV